MSGVCSALERSVLANFAEGVARSRSTVDSSLGVDAMEEGGELYD